MKKFSKVFLMISGILAVLGIVLIIAGISMGGYYVVTDDILGGRLAFGFDNNVVVENSEIDNANDLVEDGNTFSKEEINSIVLNGKYGEFEVDVWDNDSYAIQGIEGSDRVKYSIENGVLTISMTGKYLWYRRSNVKVKICVPKDVTLTGAELNVGAGTLVCSNIKIQELNVNIGAGEGNFSNIEAFDSKFNVGAGEGEITNSNMTNCNLKVGLGEFNIEGSINGNTDIDCGTGSVELKLSNEYNDFNYTVKVGAGDVGIGDREYSGISNNVSLNNDSDKTMNIKCGLGDVSIEFDNR